MYLYKFYTRLDQPLYLDAYKYLIKVVSQIIKDRKDR